MATSRSMQPEGASFFPTIFFRNQFRSTPTWPPPSTDLTGKTAIVTGANQGLGYEACRQLLALKLSHLILAVRSQTKGEAAALALQRDHPTATIEVSLLDMSSYDSIRVFTSRISHIDIAILNAGIRKTKHSLNPSTSHEETLQTNYLSTALLATLLLPHLKPTTPTTPARLTIVGSGLAHAAKFPTRTSTPLLPPLDDPSNFDVMDTYNISKLLVMLYVDKLSTLIPSDRVIINVVDPGFVADTGLSRDLSLPARFGMGLWKRLAARSVAVGASTYVDAAVVKGRESHGGFVMSWRVSPLVGMQYTEEGEVLRERLWEETMGEFREFEVRGVVEGLKG